MASKKSKRTGKAAATHKAAAMVRPKNEPATPAVAVDDQGNRRFTPASFRKRRMRRRAEKQVARTPLPNAFRVMGRAVGILRAHWEIFGGLLLIYAIIDILLVGGLSGNTDLQTVKGSLDELFKGNFGQIGTGFTLFAFLVSQGTGVASGVASAYQTVLLVVISLSMVWALRQLYAGQKIRIREALYNSSYPLMQLLLVLLMLSVHLLPAVFGSFLFSSLVANGVLTVVWQQTVIVVIAFLLFGWTFYLLCHSIIAAYIVTLPGVTPLAALRTAKELVRYRRGAVLRKLLFLPLTMAVVMVLIMIPLTAIYTPAATAVYFAMTVLSVPVVHAYIYTLYRELMQ